MTTSASLQVSLWLLRVAVGTVSHVDLPFDSLVDAITKAFGAEVGGTVGVDVPASIFEGQCALSGIETTDVQSCKVKDLQGKAYAALCAFMRNIEHPAGGHLAYCSCCAQPSVGRDWKDSMVQVDDGDGGTAWVLRENQEAYERAAAVNAAAPDTRI